MADGTLCRSEETRRRHGAERQKICRSVLGEAAILSHRNKGFVWLPLDKGIRAEPIVSRLKEQGVLVSGAEPFTTTLATLQALRLAFGGIGTEDLSLIFQTIREAV
ncbi:aminotransferase-like domain-containing protein [Pseudooceanicola spongiae]|uniref:hypothetical protein n=1 Tax=Pseudooceanicola spongiae TaxID=2613965 RepID=UPI001D030C50|nr:hypothetical protein [Pseudooceanicola spongiae]